MYIFLTIIIIFVGVTFRLIDHLPNFTPLAALALFSGTYLNRKLAIFLPITALFISDLFIGFYQPSLMVIVYGSFVLFVIIGWWLRDHKKWTNILLASILAGVIFYLITNFAVWAFSPWYTKDISGLLSCYYLALPFFRNTLAGNLIYTTAFFASYELLALIINRKISSYVISKEN